MRLVCIQNSSLLVYRKSQKVSASYCIPFQHSSGKNQPVGGFRPPPACLGLRYHKIGLIQGQPSGNSDGKSPGTWVESRCKASGGVVRGGGCWCLELTHAQLLLEVNIYKTIWRIECSRYCCGLYIMDFFQLFLWTEELQIFEVDWTLVFKEGSGICQFCKASSSNFISQQMQIQP